MHRITKIRAMIGVDNVQNSVDFYTRMFGFKIGDVLKHGSGLGWAALYWPGAELMITGQHSPTSENDRASRKKTILYFNDDDVVALHDHVNRQGGRTSPLRVTFYQMKEFSMEDPDGYHLCFGQATDEPPTPCEEDD